ncbi:MAG: hypothetical protein ACFCUQ_15030 [Kiloniellales bacterium]
MGTVKADPRRIFDPVGRCIYCGRTAQEAGSKLSKEHIIPASLDGVLILPQASCDDCADITKGFEGFCARVTFQSARTFLKLHKRRKWSRPKSFTVYDVDKDGESPREVPTEQMPHMIALPLLPPPGLAIGKSYGADYGFAGVWQCQLPGYRAKFDALGKNVQLSAKFELGPFSRMLAKIGHALAVAYLGYGTFEPYLPDIILGKRTNAVDYVGGAEGKLPPQDSLHGLFVGVLREHPNIIALVSLFQPFGAPTYRIEVGRPILEKIKVNGRPI